MTNPYGEEITLVRRYLDFGPRRTDVTNTAFSTVAGLRGDIGLDHSWNVEVTRHTLRNLQVGAGGQINEPAVIEAFTNGDLDPFIFNVQTEANKDAFDSINTTTFREGVSNLQTYSFNFDGLLPVELPGGQMGYATGFEFRHEKFKDRSDNLSKEDKILGSAGSDGKGDRENEALYLEVALPVLDNVDLSLATRYDEIDHKESATTYKFGATYSPISTLKLRASYGTGFKAPGMHELFLGTSFGVTEAVDVATCGDDEPCEINTISGGNKELEPEESVSYNIGIVNQITSALSLSLDYWDITIENKVDNLDLQSILNDPSKFGDLIQRDASGRLNTTGSFVRTNLQNLSEETSAGLEFKLTYAEKLGPGRISTNLLLNKLMKSKTQQTAADPLCDLAEDNSGIDGRLNVSYDIAGIGTDLIVRRFAERTTYTGGFVSGTCDRQNPDSEFQVESYTQLDLGVRYQTPFNTYLSLGVNNLTDAEPAYDKNESWPWYDQQRYSNMGRFYYLQATHEFK